MKKETSNLFESTHSFLSWTKAADLHSAKVRNIPQPQISTRASRALSPASEGMRFSHLNLSRASNNILTGRFITIFAISSQPTTNLYNFYRIRVFSMPGDFLTRTCIREKEDQDSEKRRPSCPDSLPDGFGSQMRKKS